MLSTEQWERAKMGSAGTWDFSGANSVNSFGMSGLELVLHGIPRKTKSCFWPQEVTVLLGRVGAERGDIKCEGYWRKELIPEGQGWWGGRWPNPQYRVKERQGVTWAFEVDIAYVFHLPHSLPSGPTQCSLGIVTHSRLIRGKLRHKIWGQPWSLGWLLPESLSDSPVEARGPHWAVTEGQTSYSNLYKQIHVGKSDGSAGEKPVSGKAVTHLLEHPWPAPPAFPLSCVLFLHIISWVRAWEADPFPLLPGEQAPRSKSGTCTLTSSVIRPVTHSLEAEFPYLLSGCSTCGFVARVKWAHRKALSKLWKSTMEYTICTHVCM